MSQSVKLYGAARTTCTRRVLATLEEKGVEYELIPVDLMKGEHKKPEFLALQPFGQIPVLVDGDVTVFETRAIARYIATKWANQGPDLLGKDLKTQAEVNQWIEVESQNFNGPIHAAVIEAVFKLWYGKTTDEEVLAQNLKALNQVLDVYEARLSKQPYLAGQDFTLADLSHLSYMHALVYMGDITEPLDTHPNVKAWWQRISSRPSWVKISARDERGTRASNASVLQANV